MSPKIVVRLFAALLCSAVAILAQAPQNPPVPAPRPQFFAGTVTELDAQHITVSRTLIGRSPEKRTFLIGPRTKMSKSLRVKSRVTVRYEHLPEGDVALEIQLHPAPHVPKSS
jgi:hypothetical protein